uniref:Uncharacterized protein n=1 Tax=Panagrolaimus superbus TaxID=310955 RepID=A0A914YLU8_9BILA
MTNIYQQHFLNLNNDFEARNDLKKSKSANNSTLSLHIAAYENAIEADGSKKELLQKSETTGLIKKWKNLNNCVPGLTLVIQNPFEFPRQQDNNQNNRPQIMQFNAAQKLLNPNRASMMASRPPLPPHQGQLYHPYSYHPYAQQYRYPIQQYRYPPQHYQQPPLHYQQPPPQQQNPPHQQQIHPIEIPEIQALEEKETTAHESEGASDNEQSLATEEEKRLAAEYPFIEYPDTQHLFSFLMVPKPMVLHFLKF